LYCPKASDTETQFASNVGAKCVAKGNYNSCFNTVQREAATAKRKAHGAAEAKEDSAAGESL
jgi:hypothetical protein